MEQNDQAMRKLIEAFISSTKSQINHHSGIDLTEESISGSEEFVNDELFYIGQWRLDKVEKGWEATYSEAISDSEDVEVVLEIEKTEDAYVVRDWYIRELF